MPAINATVAEMKDARGGSTGGWTGREEQQCPRRPIGRWRAPAPCWAPMVAGVRPELPAQRQAGSRTPPSLADLPAACPRHVAVHRQPSPALGLFWNPTFSHGVSLPFHPAPCKSVGIADSAHRLRGFSKATATAETLELVTRSRSRFHLRRRRCLATLVPSV